LQVDKLIEQNQSLEDSLADKRLRIQNAGNLAEAALEINDCFRSAQNAAEQYLNEIKMIREETLAEKQRILEQANAKAAEIISDANAKRIQGNNCSFEDGVLKECVPDN
jgi:vacuolar-type H+-ATPase subunit H